MNSTRSTDFITPKSNTSLMFRNAVLTLAKDHAFARALVNSGRLSVPACLSESSLNTPDSDAFNGAMVPGAAMDDAPVEEGGAGGWLLERVGNHFMLVLHVADPAAIDAATVQDLLALAGGGPPVEVLLVSPKPGRSPEGLRLLVDSAGCYAERYDSQPGTAYLVRPDQHVAARWRTFEARQVKAALARASGSNLQS